MKRILLTMIIISSILFTGCGNTIEKEPCKDVYEEYIIEDIIKYDVNDWGSDGCVFKSNRGKISVKGDSQCMSQIGDVLYKEIESNDSCDSYISNSFHKRIYSTSEYEIVHFNRRSE